MLHEEVALYRKLSGDMNEETPISRIGGYLDGYEKGLSVIEDIKSEIKELSELDHAEPTYEDCKRDVLEIIDRHTSGAKTEGEE